MANGFSLAPANNKYSMYNVNMGARKPNSMHFTQATKKKHPWMDHWSLTNILIRVRNYLALRCPVLVHKIHPTPRGYSFLIYFFRWCVCFFLVRFGVFSLILAHNRWTWFGKTLIGWWLLLDGLVSIYFSQQQRKKEKKIIKWTGPIHYTQFSQMGYIIFFGKICF